MVGSLSNCTRTKNGEPVANNDDDMHDANEAEGEEEFE